jgi:16S rRNA (adenine1518-N6/adenine1519-N6)-dimethyltransferase
MNLKAIAPKKSLGQNFLIDRNIARKIVSLLEIENNDSILEIGPGTGALTSLLLEKDCNLTAVEIDERAINDLKIKYPNSKYPKFNLVNQNFKDYKFVNETPNNLKVIGNIPYYLSSEILFKLFESDVMIKTTVMTIQKELAERLVAKPGTKDYGILTLALNMKAKCKIEFDISPQCFYPAPNVWSSVIKIDFYDYENRTQNYPQIMSIIRQAFNQRRKMMGNTLKSYLNQLKYEEISNADNERLELIRKNRPEQLIVDDFVFLHNIFSNFS